MLVVFPNNVGELKNDGGGNRRIFLDEEEKVFLLHGKERRILAGDGGCRAPLGPEHGHFPERVLDAEMCEQDLLGSAMVFQYLDFPVHDDIEIIGGVALIEKDISLLEGDFF